MGILDRVAGAPITWGVDGSPGWGHLMDPDRVLAEMAEIGLTATELGPDGYLGDTTDDILDRLARHGLGLVGGFVPVVLYQQQRAADGLAYFERATKMFAAAGASIAVLGADSHYPGYDNPIALDDPQWDSLFANLDQLETVAGRSGVTVAVHPHWGMAVENQHDVDLLLSRSDVGFCLDTGHFSLAEIDTAAFIARAATRIHHVHLKDLDLEFAQRVRAGDIGFRQAVIDGMFKPLGEGGANIGSIVKSLEKAGFEGWYVLEQDVALTEDPPPGAGPIEGATRSIDFLRTLADEVRTSQVETSG